VPRLCCRARHMTPCQISKPTQALILIGKDLGKNSDLQKLNRTESAGRVYVNVLITRRSYPNDRSGNFPENPVKWNHGAKPEPQHSASRARGRIGHRRRRGLMLAAEEKGNSALPANLKVSGVQKVCSEVRQR
jgi:hypothetical protein